MPRYGTQLSNKDCNIHTLGCIQFDATDKVLLFQPELTAIVETTIMDIIIVTLCEDLDGTADAKKLICSCD